MVTERYQAHGTPSRPAEGNTAGNSPGPKFRWFIVDVVEAFANPAFYVLALA